MSSSGEITSGNSVKNLQAVNTLLQHRFNRSLWLHPDQFVPEAGANSRSNFHKTITKHHSSLWKHYVTNFWIVFSFTLDGHLQLDNFYTGNRGGRWRMNTCLHQTCIQSGTCNLKKQNRVKINKVIYILHFIPTFRSEVTLTRNTSYVEFSVRVSRRKWCNLHSKWGKLTY